jgi:hypothetical protein
MSVAEGKKVLFVIYNEIGLFPPTLNAIELTAEKVQQVFAVELVTHQTGIVYNQPNIQISAVQYVAGSRLKSVQLFFQFIKTIHQILRDEKPGFVVIYDSMAAMAIQLIAFFQPFQAEIWFH